MLGKKNKQKRKTTTAQYDREYRRQKAERKKKFKEW